MRGVLASTALAVLLAACGREDAAAPTPGAEAPVPDPPSAGPSDRVVLTEPALQAAQAPFGLLRIAPVLERRGEEVILQGLRHGRGPVGGAPDLWLSVSRPGSDHRPAPRIGATPGRLFLGSGGGGPQVEATTSGRVALYRLVADSGSPLLLRLSWRSDDASAKYRLEPARGRQAVTGSLWLEDGGQLHLAVYFDHSFSVVEGEDGSAISLRFPPGEGAIHARLALSTVDVDGARANLGELPHFDFDRAALDVRTSWDDLLGRLSVSGDEASRSRFTTALYTVLAHYGDLTDLDGRYRAADGGLRRAAPDSGHLANLDLEREQGALLPLLALVTPERQDDLVDTLLAHQRATGRFPAVTRWGRPQGGNSLAPALPVIAAAMARNADDLDPARALPPMIKEASISRRDPTWSRYLRLGYFPLGHGMEGVVSRSIEASRAQHAVAAVAARLGERDVAAAFATRALFYRQLYDRSTEWFRGKDDERAWRRLPPSGAPGSEWARDYETGDPWEALWAPARFDIDGLLSLLGGRRELARRLDRYFDPQAPGVYDHAVPALHHVPWLYVHSNAPGRARKVVGGILASAWPRVPADDACAAAWRVLATLGLYPVTPVRGDYVLAYPAVGSARLAVGDRELLIEAPGVATAADLAVARFDGVPLPGRTVSHRRLAGGGVLLFEPEAQGSRGGD